MSKKVLIISSSPRKAGNSDVLCDRFLAGALEAGNDAEKVFVRDLKIAPCVGCYYCANSHGECAQKDDMAQLLQKMIDCDVLVLASPVYFYTVCAQMKTVIDRSVARYTELKNKELYYILTAAETGSATFATSLECFHSFARCLPRAMEKGIIIGEGVFEKGTIQGNKALDEAYEAGKRIQ